MTVLRLKANKPPDPILRGKVEGAADKKHSLESALCWSEMYSRCQVDQKAWMAKTGADSIPEFLG